MASKVCWKCKCFFPVNSSMTNCDYDQLNAKYPINISKSNFFVSASPRKSTRRLCPCSLVNATQRSGMWMPMPHWVTEWWCKSLENFPTMVSPWGSSCKLLCLLQRWVPPPYSTFNRHYVFSDNNNNKWLCSEIYVGDIDYKEGWDILLAWLKTKG